MALQLKDLFWSAEYFDAGEAMEAALAQLPPDSERQANVTSWLHWLKNASYQQNIRFLNDQRSLRDALVAGDLEWTGSLPSPRSPKVHPPSSKPPANFRCGP